MDKKLCCQLDNLEAYKLAKRNNLSAAMYHKLMMNNIDEVTEKRIKTQEYGEIQNLSCSLLEHIKRKLKACCFKLEI
jgi:hypothetical protein